MDKVTCREIEEGLIEYLEGEIPDERGVLFSSHINDCLHCKKEVADVETVLKGLRGYKFQDPGEGFWREFQTDIRESLRSEDQQQDRQQENIVVQKSRPWSITGWYSRWVPAFGLAVIVLAVGILLYHWAPTGDPSKLPGLAESEMEIVNEKTLATLGPEVEYVVEAREDNGIYFELSQLDVEELDELYTILQQQDEDGLI